MESPVVIVPSNQEIKERLEALRLVNWFHKMGFNRAAFMNVMRHHFARYQSEKNSNQLSNWWYGKISDETIFEDVEKVIEKIKHE